MHIKGAINMKKLYELIKKYYLKYKEMVNYLIFGGLTTVLNFIAYMLFTRLIRLDEVLSSGLAWVVAVIFAYVVNKIFVFESKTKGILSILKEMTTFIGCRIISGITCDVGLFALMVKVLSINDIVSKIVTQVMVIVVNYLFSKLLVFRKKQS